MSLTELFRFFILLLLSPSIYFCKSTPRGSSSIYNNPNSIRKSPTQPTSGYSSPLRSDGIPKRRPLSEYSIYSLYTQPENDRDKKLAQEREQLYEAYNLLHTLAQDFQKPFDAPAVIVVGHQTSGKSALIEALMGFQFNQVGGGTKTRRPIALRMQYNPNCVQPLCFLTLENGKEEQRSLADIQAYIEAENKRLERDSTRSFDPREINIRMEYRYCPNMIVIDTPGMIHPPKGRQLTPQQRALALAAREAENLVLSKIRCQDYIILCVEDTTDWKHATTRNVVMQADPNLERTVLVTTKLDTKLPQFSEADDLEDFLKAPLIHTLFTQMLGGPFFTTVPSGRVGVTRGFENNEAFVHSVQKGERADRSFIFSKLGRNHAQDALTNVGVSRLRAFLEQRIEDSYRRNVAKIVPTLTNELRHTETKLQFIEEELKSLSLERLHQMANVFREKFAKELSQIIQGTVRINPEEWGETLELEQSKGGSFLASSDQSLSTEVWQHILDNEVGNNRNKLLGGAQYHRAIREFTIAVRHMTSPPITEDEISNAAGMTDTHNGINFMRAACVIAMEKAEVSFDPMLESLRHRTEHIMKRIYPMVLKLLERSMQSTPMDINNRPFQEVLRRIYDSFVDKTLDDCVRICREDLYGMTRFVTWDVEDKSGSSHLYRLLPTPHRMAEIWQLAAKKKQQKDRQIKGRGDVDDLLADYEEEDGDQEETEPDSDEDEGEEDENLEKEVLAIANRGGNNKANTGPKNPVAGLFNWGNKNKPSERPTVNKKLDKKSKASKTSNSSRNRKIQAKGGSRTKRENTNSNNKLVPKKTPQDYAVAAVEEDAVLSDYYKVMQLTEEMLSGSSPSRTSALVTSLVQFIISSWRNHFARSTAMKFNCYFLMPFLEKFPIYLRDELDRLYKEGMAEMFDIAETRKSLMSQRVMLQDEKEANIRLLQRFQQIASQLKSGNVGHGASQPPLSDEEEEDFDQNYQHQSYDSYESDNMTPEMPEVTLQPERPSQTSPPATPSSPRRQTPNKRSPSPTAPRPTTPTLNQADMNELDDLYSTSFTSDATNAPPKKPNNNNSNNRNVNNNNRPRNTKNSGNNNSNGNINNRNPSNSENNRKDE